MNEAASYILTVTAGAIIVAILQSLAGQGTTGAMIRLLGGILMALTVISPILKLELPDPEKWFNRYTAAGEEAAAAGKDMASESLRGIIKTQVETYILDKAALYDAELTVETELDAAGVPRSVTLTGNVSPYVKGKLTQIIEETLGLGEEAQKWIS